MTQTTLQAPKLRAQLETDLLAAAERDESSVETATLRLIMCAVHDRDAEARAHDQCSGCEDAVIRDVLALMVRQRDDSAKRYEDAGRIEMADRENEEAGIIRRYLPEPLAGPALDVVVTDLIDELDARSLKDLGRCMNELKTRFPDQIDTREAGKKVKKALA